MKFVQRCQMVLKLSDDLWRAGLPKRYQEHKQRQETRVSGKK